MKKVLILAGSLLLTTAPAFAQSGSTLNLTLEEAVRRAGENNPDLATVRLGTQVETAKVAQSESAYTPLFSTVIGGSSNATPPSNFLLGEGGIDTRDLFTSTGVRQRLAKGAGVWSVSWDTSRTSSNSPLNSFDPALASGIQFAFSQPLFRDRKMDPARQQTIIARRNQESSELRVRESGVQVMAAVKQAYWTLKATLANVTVQQRSLELAQELVRQNKARVDIGQTPPLDLLQAEAEVAQRRENLIRANTAVGDAEDRLRRLIMDPSDVSFWQTRLNPTDEPVVGGDLPDVDAVVAEAVNGRYDLARARKDLDNIATNVEQQRPRRDPLPPIGRVSRNRDGHPQSRLRQRARRHGRQQLPDMERRSHGELLARPELRGSRPCPIPGRTSPGDATDREPAAADYRTAAPGGAPGAQHRRTD
jgi:outer membrane protein TolC